MIRFVWVPFLVLLATKVVTAEETVATAIWGLEQLMQQRALVQTERASFLEVRKTPSEKSMTSSGMLVYQAPDHLERQTAKPFPERSIIKGGRLTFETETKTGEPARRHFALADLPGLRPFFTALRAVLAGDLDALRRDFEASFDGNKDSWQLKLTPRQRADHHLREILISGQAAHILVIDVRERNGDSLRTTLTPEQPEPQPPPREAPAVLAPAN